MTQTIVQLEAGRTTLSQLRTIYEHEVRIEIDEKVYEAIDASAALVGEILATGQTVYGINTGFGLLAHTRIEDDQLAELQKNLVLSHSTGVGPDIDPQTTRLILFLKLNSLALGYSGVSRTAFNTLAAFIDHDILPSIPIKGSVGASGDLAPLAHMTAALMGIGDVRYRGIKMPAQKALQEIALDPLTLGPKEGLAFLNGTQVSTALALVALFKTEHLFAAAIIAGALSVDAMQGTDAPFDARIHKVRGHQGQIILAEKYLSLLEGSDIRASHLGCDRVQDPYSLRCQPQVMGACLDIINNTSRTLLIEANAVTDNPLLFRDTSEVLSGGNFHAEPVAFAADNLALAIAEIGALAERRLALLVDPNMSSLPAFLVANSGLNSGFMIAQVTAAALASENKSLAHPASVDSIPTSANQEDHVSMATFAARRLYEMTDNSKNIIAIELLAAAQGVEFHAPHVTSSVLQSIIKRIRADVDHYDKDRYFAPDIAAASEIIESGYFTQFVDDILPSIMSH